MNKSLESQLFDAVNKGRVEEVRILLEEGVSADSTIYLIFIGTESPTVIFNAIQYGHIEIVKLLVEAGANIEATNKRNETPLFMAAEEGNVEIAMVLLEAGASLSFPPKSKWTSDITNLLFPGERREGIMFGESRDNCDELSGEIRVLKTLLDECNVSKTALKDQLDYMEEEMSAISEKMTRLKGQTANDKRDIETLRGIKATLEEKIGLLNKAVDSGKFDKARLVKEITTLKKEIVRLSRFSDSRDTTGDREESTPRGFECVKPFKKSNATRRSRLDSCVPAEGGIFDNIRTTEGGRFTNKQKCIEVCHTDD